MEWSVGWLVGVWFLAFIGAFPLRSFTWAQEPIGELVQPGIPSFFLSFVIALLLLFVLRHNKWFGHVISVSAASLIFSGLTLFINPVLALLIAIVLWAWERTARTYLVNGIFVTALAVFAGLWISVWYQAPFLLIAFVFLSIYDVLGVFFSMMIPKLALQAIAIHAPLIFAVPQKRSDWLQTIAHAKPAAIIGVGDALFPAALVASSVIHRGWEPTLPLIGGLMIGLLIAMVVARFRHVVPLFPFLCVGAMVGWFW